MFDETKYYLGALCKHGHEYAGTGKSLRYKVQWKCVQCMRDHVKKWRETNPEKKREMDRQYVKTAAGKHTRHKANHKYAQSERGKATILTSVKRYQHSRRAGGKLPTTAELNSLFDRQGHHCIYCFEPLTYTTYTIEHILPVSRGGTNTPNNLAFACGPCNSSRKDRPFSTWYGRKV